MINVAGGKRGLWVFASQALSSLANFAGFIVISRTASVSDIALFAIAASIYGTQVGLVRAGIVPAALEGGGWRNATLVVVGVSTAISVTLVSASWAWFPSLPAGLVLAASPIMLCWEIERGKLFAGRAPALASAGDAAWLAILLLSWPFLGATGSGPWVLGGTALGIVAIVRNSPSAASLWNWIRGPGRSATGYMTDTLILRVGRETLMSLVAPLVSLPLVASVRGATTVFGPLTLLVQAIMTWGHVEIAARRRLRSLGPDDVRFFVRSQVLFILVGIVLTCSCLLLFETLGNPVFGAGAETFRPAVPGVALTLGAQISATFPVVVSRLVSGPAKTIRRRLATEIPILLAGLASLYFASALAFSITLGIGTTVTSIVWNFWFLREVRGLVMVAGGATDTLTEARARTVDDE